MTRTHARRLALLLAGAQLGQAAIVFAQPPAVLRRVMGEHDLPPLWIMRVLGVRLAVQAVTEVVSPRPPTLRVNALVDVTHAASMIVAAKVWPRYRRAALVSAGSATCSAVAVTVAVRQPR